MTAQTIALLTILTGVLLVLSRKRDAGPVIDAYGPLSDAVEPARGRPRLAGAALVVGGLLMIGAALLPGDRPEVPAVAVTLPRPPAAPVVEPAEPLHTEPPISQSLAYAAPVTMPVSVTLSAPFIWPAIGDITSEIGPLHPNGIDIGLKANVDEPIYATARGTVTFAGGGPRHEYGYHVTIDHGGEIETLYAHMQKVSVAEGDVVRQGALLGLGGSTGHSDGKHLHFEIRSKGQQVNPLQVLPKRDAPQPGAPMIIDCAKHALVINSGAPMLVDVGGLLGSGNGVSEVRLEAVAVSPRALPATATVESETAVLVDTSPTVTGTGADDEYRLTLLPSPATDLAEVTCTVFVRTKTVRTVFYVRPTATPDPDDPGTPTPTPTPTMTPTPGPSPTPTWTPRPNDDFP